MEFLGETGATSKVLLLFSDSLDYLSTVDHHQSWASIASFCSPLHPQRVTRGSDGGRGGAGGRSTTYVLATPMVVRQRWRRTGVGRAAPNVVDVYRMEGRYGSEGPVDGWRVSSSWWWECCTDKKSSGPTERVQAGGQGDRGRGSRHNRLHSVAFAGGGDAVRHWLSPEGEKVWEPVGGGGSGVGRWKWELLRGGTKAEPLLHGCKMQRHQRRRQPASRFCLLPFSTPWRYRPRSLPPFPERAFSAVDFLADAIVTLQYRRPKCFVGGMFYSGPILES